jgi:predicted nucleic acid-binding protein
MRFVDSNIFVYNLAADPNYGQKAKDIFEKIEAGEKSTSTLVILKFAAISRNLNANNRLTKILPRPQSRTPTLRGLPNKR